MPTPKFTTLEEDQVQEMIREIGDSSGYDGNEALLFAGKLFESVNEHDLAHAMWSMYMGDVDLAKEFLAAANSQPLSKGLNHRMLMDQYQDLFEEEEDMEEEEG